MKYILFILSTALALTACSPRGIDQTEAFESSELYQGYPCREYCAAFQKGYDTAVKAGITTKDGCTGDSIEEIAGCQAFVSDYQYDNQNYAEYLESL